MNKLNQIFISLFLLAAFSFYCINAQAQDIMPQANTDSSTIKMAAQLSISRNEAKQIQAAYNYRHPEIDRLVKEGTMNPKERVRQLRQLLSERRSQLDVAVPTAKKEQLKSIQAATHAEIQAKLDSIKQRHIQQVGRMPHTQSLISPQTASDANQTQTVNHQ